ncbi:hypothetical protein Scep_026655 [Stephania cephalantha]|uniref:Uncharacterized protein n=1 Tax=Stephania cephalantha TaxID=152367 RepID=A0AAP0EKL3_9MAGN
MERDGGGESGSGEGEPDADQQCRWRGIQQWRRGEAPAGAAAAGRGQRLVRGHERPGKERRQRRGGGRRSLQRRTGRLAARTKAADGEEKGRERERESSGSDVGSAQWRRPRSGSGAGGAR